MSRVDLEQYRASILKAQNSDQLAIVVGELCDVAGYPYNEDWSIRDNADAACLQGAAPLGHMLDIAARRERSYKQGE